MFHSIVSIYFLMIFPPVGAAGGAFVAGGDVDGGTIQEYAGEYADSSPVLRTAFAVK